MFSNYLLVLIALVSKLTQCIELNTGVSSSPINDTMFPEMFTSASPILTTVDTILAPSKQNLTTTIVNTTVNRTMPFIHNSTSVNLNASFIPNQNQPLLNTDVKKDGVNSYSQLSKFLVNSSQEVPIKTQANNASGASSLSLMIILVSLVAVVFVIAGIITALFVMKRRFSILRINGSKCGDDGHNNDGAANGMLTSNSGSDSSNHSETVSTSDAKCIEINEKDTVDALKEAANDQHIDLVCVENKQAILLPVSSDNEAKVVIESVAVTNEESGGSSEELLPKEDDGLVAAVTEGELVNTEVLAVETVTNNDVNEVVMTTLQVEATTTTVTTNTTSSSSLIANVLNELSESVVLKLQSSDPEKQPLNLE
jgi:hypothetical protein